MHCRPDIVYCLSTWDCVCVCVLLLPIRSEGLPRVLALVCAHTQLNKGIQLYRKIPKPTLTCMQCYRINTLHLAFLVIARLMPRLTHSHKILHVSYQFCSYLLHRISPHSLGSLCDVEDMCGFAFCASERHRVYIIYPSSSRAAILYRWPPYRSWNMSPKTLDQH